MGSITKDISVFIYVHLYFYESEKGSEGNPRETPPLFGKPKSSPRSSHDSVKCCLAQPTLEFTHSQHFKQINRLHQILLVLTRSVTNPAMLLHVTANKALMKTCNCHASFTTSSLKSFLVVVFLSFVQQYFSYG